jgi:hypothetical protein
VMRRSVYGGAEMRDDEANAGRVRFVATFRRERERVNGEEGVIGGGGVAG